MIERIVVEVLREGKWFYAGDFHLTKEEDAKRKGRDLWRAGAAGVRISRFQREILVEHHRQEKLV